MKSYSAIMVYPSEGLSYLAEEVGDWLGEKCIRNIRGGLCQTPFAAGPSCLLERILMPFDLGA
jgi:hypothetical protein